MLGEGKYSPSVEPAWKAGIARFLAFYKALVNDPDPGVRRDLYKVVKSRVSKQGGLARSREGSRVYSSNQDQSRCTWQFASRDGSRIAGGARAYVPLFKTNLDAHDRSEWD